MSDDSLFAEFAATRRADVRGSTEDPFFTARVLDALPEPLRFTGLSPRHRIGVLAMFYVAATAVAFAIFAWAAPETVASATEQAHDWLAVGAELPGPWLTAAALGVVAVVALVASRSRACPEA